MVDNYTMTKPDTETADLLLTRIDGLLGAMGKTRYWLDKEVTGGKATKVVTEIERKRAIPREPRLHRIAEVLGTTVDFLMGRSDNPQAITSEVRLSDKALEWHGQQPGEPGIPLVGTGDCADLTVTETETGEDITVDRASFDPDFHVRYIARPPALTGARDLYAIYFHGASMEPRWEAGEVGIVDPRRPVRSGDYVLVQLTNGDGPDVVTVLAKRLVRQSAKDVVLEQFNPPITFTVPRAKVARIHRIMQQTDLLFG